MPGCVGLELMAHEAGDPTIALRHYERIVATADPKRDALWLPQDTTTVDDDNILPSCCGSRTRGGQKRTRGSPAFPREPTRAVAEVTARASQAGIIGASLF